MGVLVEVCPVLFAGEMAEEVALQFVGEKGGGAPADEFAGALDFAFLQEESGAPVLEHGLRDGVGVGCEFLEPGVAFFAIEFAPFLEVIPQFTGAGGRGQGENPAKREDERGGKFAGKDGGEFHGGFFRKGNYTRIPAGGML